MALFWKNIIDIIVCAKRDVAVAFSAIERDFIKMGLVANKLKTKYMLVTLGNMRRIGSHITDDNFPYSQGIYLN